MSYKNEPVLNIAVFCDYENVAIGVRDANYDSFDINMALERILDKGKVVVKKAYADWERYRNARRPLHEAAFELIEIPHLSYSGKNSADIRLVVDALDLCYTKEHVHLFVIISGDSDFSPLVSKLRENNKTVIGLGVKSSSSDLLVDNCDEFIYYDDLVRARRSEQAATRREALAKVALERKEAEKKELERREADRKEVERAAERRATNRSDSRKPDTRVTEKAPASRSSLEGRRPVDGELEPTLPSSPSPEVPITPAPQPTASIFGAVLERPLSTDRSGSDKAAGEKTAGEKGTSDKGTAEKGTAEKGTAEKGTADRATAEKPDPTPEPPKLVPTSDGPGNKLEALRWIVETTEALLQDTDNDLYGSMVKQVLKRKRPHFLERYYGYRSFNEILQDAEARGLLEMQKDVESGGYRILRLGPNA